MLTKNMILGERQSISLEFSRSDGGVISEASYSMRTPSRTWEEELAATLESNVVSFTFEPQELGVYLIEVLVVYQDGQTDIERGQITVIGGR